MFRLVLFGTPQGLGCKNAPLPILPNICHTYPTMMKPSTFIPDLTKIQNTYESHDTPIKYTHQYFLTKNQQL